MSVDDALLRCPFLKNVCSLQSVAYARSVAINPLVCASGHASRSSFSRPGGAPFQEGRSHQHQRQGPILEEEGASEACFEATFRLFHGRNGIFPLPKPMALEEEEANLSAAPIPTHVPSVPSLTSVELPPTQRNVLPEPTCVPKGGGRALPLAVMSLGMPDFFGDFFRHHLRKDKRVPGPKSEPLKRPPKPQRAPKPTSASTTLNPPSSLPPPPPPPPPPPLPSVSASLASGGGLCPLRKFLGPTLSSIIFNSAGHVQCPTPIIQARAALAATAPIRQLRPQALHIKLAAVAAIALAVNVPCGMVREHTTKFSWQWVLAVHASIPFVAMLRKAVIMPKLAIICTIAAAVAGQAMGARMERERLLEEKARLATEGKEGMGEAQSTIKADMALLKQNAAKVKVMAAPGARQRLLGEGRRGPAPAPSGRILWSADDDWRMMEVGCLFNSFKPLSLPSSSMPLPTFVF